MNEGEDVKESGSGTLYFNVECEPRWVPSDLYGHNVLFNFERFEMYELLSAPYSSVIVLKYSSWNFIRHSYAIFLP